MEIKSRLKDFFFTRFTTSEFENCILRSGYPYNFLIFHFDDKLPNYPSEVIGNICIYGKSKLVKWNKYGECFSKTGSRLKRHDLMVLPNGESLSSQLVFVSAFGIITVLIILYLTR
jgi:hypothetical protein